MKNTGAGQLSQASADYGQLGNEGTQAFNQVDPMLAQMLPLLMQTITGGNTALMQAARAPVIGQTQQNIRTMQNQGLGSMANPNAMWQDTMQTGQQQAGIAGDQMLGAAMQSLQSLIGGGMNFSGSALSNAGQGEAQVGEYENQANAQMWSNLLGAAGTAAGLMSGGGAGGALNFGGMAGGGSTIPGAGAIMDSQGFNPYTSGLGSGSLGQQFGGSTPYAMGAPISTPTNPGLGAYGYVPSAPTGPN